MQNDAIVEVYYGPSSWFQEKRPNESHALLDVVYALDEASRRHTHRVEGQERPEHPTDPVFEYDTVVAESSDYASLTDHSVMNFVGIMRRINVNKIVLQNPPDRIYRQLERVFHSTTEYYDYPVVELDTIKEFDRGYEEKVVGQPRVKSELLAALYRLTSPGRRDPVVLMFYGPSGVGKTETAKYINSLLGGELMRKQFSMYHTERFASYIFGGAHQEPSFAHDLLDRESGVILIDEFDKANPVFHGAFYQFFDEGVFEDKNYRLDVGPALIICTSNYSSKNDIRNALGDALYSRFDALIGYERLSIEALTEISGRIIDSQFSRLTDDEKKLLKREDVRRGVEQFIGVSDGNVRRIAKISEQVISLMLVREIIK